ncbi:MAG TPA: carbamoyltransferase HypF [Gemmatimonadaceae bacterium]|nr:carbamoyltransferase HypF [Gemmatimonadaceae bacterium]
MQPAVRNADASDRRRVRVFVRGMVQGVGFRPYVYRLGRACGLSGVVRNDGRGVTIEAEGPSSAVAEFLRRLPMDAPALATIERVAVDELCPQRATRDDDATFAILGSDSAGDLSALITPDTATCDACLAELFDPHDRRFRYPFINCTDCGPRFTIVRGVPYDRPLTTMAGFTMCERCRAEYEDPADRRFHAQPNACPACGPAVRLLDASGSLVSLDGTHDPILTAAAAIRAGAIVAVKGLGGYHLACRSDDAEAVARLRARKHREEKPFAVMVRDLAAARSLVELDDAEEALLTDRARPIVLARRRAGARVAPAVAPGHRDLGVMLPYSPLHHLLLRDADATLVMTSGNRSDEPIAFRDADVLERLAAIADLFLVHDRPIETRTDDSVMRVVTLGTARRVLSIRRSRGYVPSPVSVPMHAERAVLACGGNLKNTFCLVRGDRAFVGHHIGDLENLETLQSFTEGIAHVGALFAVTPDVVAHDLHPEYLSTKYALDRRELEPIGVQHHHAHLAACLAEHGERGPAIGVIFDGTGYGTDGTIWGGELLLGDLTTFERAGHLYPVRLPGGEAAIREPWRMACAWLVAVHNGAPPIPSGLRDRIDERQWAAVAHLARTGLASPVTTSAGRLFDAVAALCGVRLRVSYEGQAAIELEMAADGRVEDWYDMPVVRDGDALVLDARPLVRGVEDDVANGRPVAEVAACVHMGVSRAAVDACRAIAERSGVRTVVLSGGVFQNVLLLERTARALMADGFGVLVPERLPPNDGGVSYGQAVVALGRSA